MKKRIEIKVDAESSLIGERIDKALSHQPEIGSRSRSESLIESGGVQVNNKVVKTSYKIRLRDLIQIEIPEEKSKELTGYDLKLDVLFEDSDIIVINKPTGLVVHPSAGHTADTLVNALIHHAEDFDMKFGEERPGIVHRLDKDTSGILVVAKNDKAQAGLVQQFKDRSVHRIYQAVVFGRLLNPQGTVTSYLARHPNNRMKYSSVRDASGRILKKQEDESEVSGKWAITNYKKLQALDGGFDLVQLKLETGRTHQIRVHMAEIGNALVGDPIYSEARHMKKITNSGRPMITELNPRLCLHAMELGFTHPTNGKALLFKALWPKDIRSFLEKIGVKRDFLSES